MTIPLLPSLRSLTATLRALHRAFAHPDAGGEYVRLVCLADGRGGFAWVVSVGSEHDGEAIACTAAGTACVFGWEFVPGDDDPFDPVAAARRLLAAAHDGGVRA